MSEKEAGGTPGPLGPMRLVTDRLVVRTATLADVPALVAFHREEDARLARWTPARPEGFLTTAHFEERVARFLVEMEAGVSLRVFAWDPGERAVVGLVSVTSVFALPVPQAQIGYAIAGAHEGRGLVTEAARAVLGHLAERGLRRVTATHDVANARSPRVLERLGFVREASLPGHLVTDGAPRDHVLWSRALP